MKITELRLCSLIVAISLAGLAGCGKGATPVQASTVSADTNPADGNLAPAGQSTAATEPVTSTLSGSPDNQSNAQSYAANSDLSANGQEYPADYATEPPVESTEPPPPLPVYTQPPCPGDGYYWTPGYWAWANGGYYWVPGAWVLTPWVDALWTPPYWGFVNGYYVWNAGYWGPHVGFYGGIDYGFGYSGLGFYGAYWNQGRLFYNRNVTNVNVNVVHNVYNYAAPRGNYNRVSYNGGRGGIATRPTSQEMAVARDPRTPAVAAQVQHAREAASNHSQFAAGGRAQPARLAESTPLHTNYRAPAARPPAAAMHAAAARPATPAAPQRTEARPAQQERPAPQRAAAPRPEARPAAPRVAARPAAPRPEARPAPQRAAAPRPEARPAAPRVAARPAAPRPEARPAPQRAAAPRPEARPAAPRVAARPAPAKPEEKPEEKH